MSLRRRVTLAYLGYALALASGLAYGLAAAVQQIVFLQVEAGRLDGGWLDGAYAASHSLRYGAILTPLAALAAFALACLPPREAAPAIAAQRAYLRRFAAIALAFWMLVFLTGLAVGWLAEAAALAVFAWGAWSLAGGWRAHRAGAGAEGPAGWRLLLLGCALAAAGVVVFFIVLAVQGGRLISG